MLAKSGDIAFGFAVDDAIDTMTWRKMKERVKINLGEKFIGIRLEWFLALMSSTGMEGLLRILFRRRREGWRRNSAGRWAFIRLVFILALIPGPGMILTANIKQQNVFFPIRTLDISGGIAEFDPELAPTFHTVLGPSIARYVQTMLQDRSVTWPVKPISKDCRKEKTCESYLIAGPYQAISPWPFTAEKDKLEAYRVYDAPFVQVDLWYPPPSLTFSESRDCTLYGGANATSDYSLILCIAEQSTDGRLAAGWKTCQQGYAVNGTCLLPGAPNSPQGWSTYLAFYHRKATITFSRSEFLIQEVSLHPSHTPYNIPSTSLFTAISSVLYQPNIATNDPRFDRKSMQYILTSNIATMLWQSLQPGSESVSFSRDWLRNILTMPIYVFQPTMTAFSRQLTPLATDNGTLPQPNLPAENYVKGAYCTISNRSIPSWGTVLAYAIVAGVVLVFVGTAKLVAGCLWPAIETSEFPMLDFDVLTRVADQGGKDVELRTVFAGGYDGREILGKIKDLRVGLR
ncbi:hypothetical protein BDV96DRAFT_633921 [Lophiotrema nucula]|uniref:Uncharacterized protein n=1 Tax=Lophiotrema nucula TaxID=690887 RepID=A0A6A5Z2Q2_9PLEO|nr:hypothetical protein BDV96DRAFT_633921 [Lophiotrema nucula]